MERARASEREREGDSASASLPLSPPSPPQTHTRARASAHAHARLTRMHAGAQMPTRILEQTTITHTQRDGRAETGDTWRSEVRREGMEVGSTGAPTRRLPSHLREPSSLPAGSHYGTVAASSSGDHFVRLHPALQLKRGLRQPATCRGVPWGPRCYHGGPPRLTLRSWSSGCVSSPRSPWVPYGRPPVGIDH